MGLFYCFPTGAAPGQPPGERGGIEYKKRWGCLSRILKWTPKGDQSGNGSRIF